MNVIVLQKRRGDFFIAPAGERAYSECLIGKNDRYFKIAVRTTIFLPEIYEILKLKLFYYFCF